MNEVPRIRNPIPTNTRAPVIRSPSDELVSATTLSPCKKSAPGRKGPRARSNFWQNSGRVKKLAPASVRGLASVASVYSSHCVGGSPRLQEIGNLKEYELVVVGLIWLPAGRERQIVVIADDDVALVHHVDVLDCEEWECKHAVIERLARFLVRIPNLHEVNVGDLAHRLTDIGVR